MTMGFVRTLRIPSGDALGHTTYCFKLYDVKCHFDTAILNLGRNLLPAEIGPLLYAPQA